MKSDNAYKTIGEVAKILGLVDDKKGTVSTHTIRFWEKEFKQVKPKILNGNRLEMLIKEVKNNEKLVIYDNESSLIAIGKYTDGFIVPLKVVPHD